MSVRNAAACGLALALGLLPAAAATDYKVDFRKGMEAADLQRWQEAADSFRAAIGKNPVESEERIFLSGVFSTPYLPHFQLGRSLFLASRDNCSQALAEWDLSESQGAIRDFVRLYEELAAGRRECTRLLLPSAVAAADSAIDSADTALEAIPVPPSDEAREGEWQTAVDRLRQARQELDRGQSDADLAAVRSAADMARAAGEELERLAGLEEAQRTVAAPAVGAAERAIANAEAEMKGRQQVAETMASAVPTPEAEPREDAPAAVRPTSPPAQDGSVAIRLGHLIADAEALLDGTDPDGTGSDLLATQHLRLHSTLELARDADAEAMLELSERISASMEVIRLVSAAHGLFTGQPERTIELLDETPSSRDAVAAHAHLLLAAARYSLSRRQPDREAALRALAANEVRHCSELAPSLQPDSAMFSPAFASFFRRHSAGAGAVPDAQNR